MTGDTTALPAAGEVDALCATLIDEPRWHASLESKEDVLGRARTIQLHLVPARGLDFRPKLGNRAESPSYTSKVARIALSTCSISSAVASPIRSVRRLRMGLSIYVAMAQP